MLHREVSTSKKVKYRLNLLKKYKIYMYVCIEVCMRTIKTICKYNYIHGLQEVMLTVWRAYYLIFKAICLIIKKQKEEMKFHLNDGLKCLNKL